MAETLCVLIAFALVFGIGAGIEQARRPKTLHADDWTAEGGVRR